MNNVQAMKLIAYLLMFVWFIVLPILAGVYAERKNRSCWKWVVFSLLSSFLIPGILPGGILGMLMLYILPKVEGNVLPSGKAGTSAGWGIKLSALRGYVLVLSFSCWVFFALASRLNKSLPWLTP